MLGQLDESPVQLKIHERDERAARSHGLDHGLDCMKPQAANRATLLVGAAHGLLRDVIHEIDQVVGALTTIPALAKAIEVLPEPFVTLIPILPGLDQQRLDPLTRH